MTHYITVPGTDSIRVSPIYPESEGGEKYEDVLFDFDDCKERLSLILRNGALTVHVHLTKKEADYLLRGLAKQFGYEAREMKWPGTVHVSGLDLYGKYFQSDFEGNEDGVEFSFEFSPHYGKSRVEFDAEFILSRKEAVMLLGWLSSRLGWELSPPLETVGEFAKVPFPVRINEECETAKDQNHLRVVK